MKRSRLARRTPLKAGGSLKRSEGLKRVSWPSPKVRARTDAERARMAAWREAVTRKAKCVSCGSRRDLQGHHVPRRQVIERLGGDPWDPVCGIAVCVGCHERHHGSGVVMHRLPRRLIPERVWVFARALGGEAVVSIEREYPAW